MPVCAASLSAQLARPAHGRTLSSPSLSLLFPCIQRACTSSTHTPEIHVRARARARARVRLFCRDREILIFLGRHSSVLVSQFASHALEILCRLSLSLVLSLSPCSSLPPSLPPSALSPPPSLSRARTHACTDAPMVLLLSLSTSLLAPLLSSLSEKDAPTHTPCAARRSRWGWRSRRGRTCSLTSDSSTRRRAWTRASARRTGRGERGEERRGEEREGKWRERREEESGGG